MVIWWSEARAGTKVELADIVRRHGAAFRAAHRLCAVQHRALRAIEHELYAKAKVHGLSDTGFSPTPAHDKAMTKLNDLRNGFVHFGAKGWSIELAGLPSICLQSLEVGDRLGWKSGAVNWRSNAQSRRARDALRALSKSLSTLDKVYKA